MGYPPCDWVSAPSDSTINQVTQPVHFTAWRVEQDISSLLVTWERHPISHTSLKTAEAHAKPCVHTVNSPGWKDLSKVHLDPWKLKLLKQTENSCLPPPLPFLKSPTVCRTKSFAERVALKLSPSASEIKHAHCFFPNGDACWPLLSRNIKLSHFNFSGFLKVTLGNTNQSTPRGARTLGWGIALLLLSQSSTTGARWPGNGDSMNADKGFLLGNKTHRSVALAILLLLDTFQVTEFRLFTSFAPLVPVQHFACPSPQPSSQEKPETLQ